MLPDAHNLPAASPECPANRAITSAVPLELFLPVLLIVSGGSVAPGTAMPEATINENGDAGKRKRKVWLARKRTVSAPTRYLGATEDRDKTRFC